MNLQNKSNKKNQNFQNIGIIMYEVCSQKKTCKYGEVGNSRK